MLIGFIGAPASGKTTVAAMLFGKLKSEEYVSDLITERARNYIIHKRRLDPQNLLTDDDQVEIFKNQAKEELVYVKVLPKTDFIITDGCSVHNYLYMHSISSGRLESIRDAVQNYDIIFYCKRNLTQFNDKDTGRVHTQEEADDIDARIPDMLKLFEIEDKVVTLIGTTQFRVDTAFKAVLTHKMKYGT